MANTSGCVYTVTKKVRVLMGKYAFNILQQCNGYDQMSKETRRVFIKGETSTICQRLE